MRQVNRQKGSITLFALLSIVLIIGFLFTLLEGSRITELRRLAQLRTDMALESVFANYNSVLWESYHLLGCNQDEAEAIITESANSGYSAVDYGVNLLRLELQEIEIQGYTLLTDADGAAYIQAVSSYMSRNVLYETAKLLYNQYEAIKKLLDTSSLTGTEIEDALESLEEIENPQASAQSYAGRSGKGHALSGTNSDTESLQQDSKQRTTEQEVEIENPLTEIQRLQKTQLLELVVPDTDDLSEAEYDMSQAVSKRELRSGVNSDVEETDWLDRVLLQQYLLTYFADYTNPKEGRALCYELEYLIAGKDNDIENLRTVVKELLLIRETANFAYLLADEAKLLQAQALATVLAGATASVAIVEVVKLGLLLAWAFAESVLDVRALLQGKTIPLIKSLDTWTLAIENIGSLGEGYLTAKESKLGISYTTYLGILLLLQSDQSLAYRAMDVQEISMQTADSSIRMDDLVVHMQITNTYQCAPVFASLRTRNGKNGWNYKISTEAAYGYQ